MERNQSRFVHEEDARPNAYTLKCIWFIIAIVAAGLIFEIANLWIVDLDIALPGLIGTLALLFVAEILGFTVSHTRSWLKYAIVFLDVAAGTLIGVFLTYHTVLIVIIPLLIAAQYSNKRVIYFAYAFSIVGIFLSAILGYEYGLCDMNMVFLSVSKAGKYGGWVSGAVEPLSVRLPSIITFYAFPRALIITAFVPMLNAIVKNRQEILLRDIKLKYAGEHDQVTNLFNRTRYNMMLKDVYVKLGNVAIVYFDLNNLKYINDTFGHDVGDGVIEKSAESIRNAADDAMDAYRLGGDEFILVIPGGGEAEAEKLLGKWKKELERINAMQTVAKCDMAYGVACGKGSQFEEVLKSAEKNMYDCKTVNKTRRGVETGG